jgi:hypothetical protein
MGDTLKHQSSATVFLWFLRVPNGYVAVRRKYAGKRASDRRKG